MDSELARHRALDALRQKVVELRRAAGLVSGDFLGGLESPAVAQVFGDATAAPSGRLPDFIRSRMTTTRAGAAVPARLAG